MFLGKVIGNVWATKKWEQVRGLKFLAIRPYTLKELAGRKKQQGPYTDLVIAADLLGACIGEDVIVAYGHAARAALEELDPGGLPRHPIDAAVIAIVDRYHVDKEVVDRYDDR